MCKEMALFFLGNTINSLNDGVTMLMVVQGSTCAFTERMLRESGFRTGLFTSPHLLDVRERFRLNGLVFGFSFDRGSVLSLYVLETNFISLMAG